MNRKVSPQVNSVVSKAQVKQMIKSALSETQELKIHIVQSTASVDYGGTIIDLSSIAQGDSDITRDGDRILVKEVDFRSFVSPGDATNLMRIILFQWVPDSATTTPLVTNVVQTTGSSTAPVSYRSIDFVKAVKIFHDEIVKVDTYHLIELGKHVIHKRGYDPQIQFTGATSRTNGIYMMVISDSAAANHPSIGYYCTLRYTDS